MGKMQLDEAVQFAADLGRVCELMPVVAVAMLRGEGAEELAEWARIRKSVGENLYREIISADCRELVQSIQEILSTKNLPVDWLS